MSSQNCKSLTEIILSNTESANSVKRVLEKYGWRPHGKSLLHYAVQHGNYRLLTWLLKNGAKVNAIERNGNTALHVSALSKLSFSRLKPIIEELLNCKAININVKNKEKQTPLHLALRRYDNLTKMFITAGADIEAVDKQKNRPIHYAVKHWNLEGFDLLVKSGANVHAQNLFGENPLMHFLGEMWLFAAADESESTAVLNFPKLMKKLLQFNPPSTAICQGNMTPMSAMLYNQGEPSKKILSIFFKNTKKNFLDALGFCPIHYIVLQRNIDKLKELLQLGCDVNARDLLGRTSLHLLLLCCNILEEGPADVGNLEEHFQEMENILQALIQHKASIHIPDKSGRLPLHYALECGLLQFVSVLLSYEDSSSTVDSADKTGIVPLHIAAARNYCSVISMLIEQGANIHKVDNYGSCALHFATFAGAVDAVEVLLTHKADASKKDAQGNTPRHLAKYRHYLKCERLLSEHFAPPEKLSPELQLAGDAISVDSLQTVRMIEEKHPPLLNDISLFTTCLSSQQLKEIEDCQNKEDKDYLDKTSNNRIIVEEQFPHLHHLSHSQPFEDILSEMYRVPGVGLVTTDLPEVSDIASAINTYLEKVLAFVGILDARFRCTLIPSGSFIEKTKVGDPDEFDFMVQLDYFTDIELMHSYDKILVDRKNVKEIENFVDLSSEPPELNGSYIAQYFQQLFAKALGLALNYLHPNLQILAYKGIIDTIFQKITFGTKNSYVLQSIWNGPNYKSLRIDIDIVVVLLFKGQYQNFHQWPYLGNFWKNKKPEDLPFSTTGIFNLLPAAVFTQSPVSADQWDFVSSNGSLNSGHHLLPQYMDSAGRASFSMKECLLISEWPKPIQKAYLYAKMLRHRCFIPSCDFDTIDGTGVSSVSYTAHQCISTYVLKTLFLHMVANHTTVEQSPIYYLKKLYKEVEIRAKGKLIYSYFVKGREIKLCKGQHRFHKQAYCVFICECVSKYLEKT